MKKNNKYTYLLNNIGLLTISNFGSKILSFVLIPLYTNLLSTEEYGTYDIYTTSISLLMPILTLNIVSAVLRYSLDKEKNKKKIFSIGLQRLIYATIFVTIGILLNNIFHIIPILERFWISFILLFAAEGLYNLMSNFARGREKIKEISIAGIINAISVLALNVMFLAFFKLGLKGYFVANIAGYLIPTIYLIFKLEIWEYIELNKVEKNLQKEMESYSKPLIFNTVGWWITNASDRYIITWMCGVATNGIYSVSYKIPSILNIFQTIFNQAWTLSAVKEHEKESSSFYTEIYTLYNLGLVLICSALIIIDKIIAKILFAKEFFEAWKFAPFLMISVVFGGLSGLLEGVFIANKDTKIIAKTTIVGAIINVVLNIIFVKAIGAMGAAISTLIAYIIVWLIRVISTNKVIKIDVRYKINIISYCILILQASILQLSLKNVFQYVLQFILFFVLVFLYRLDIKKYLKKILSKLKNYRLIKK